jgi:hypothetical protein
MARSLQVRRRGWVLVWIFAIGLVSGYLWWAGRLSRAVDRIVVFKQQHPMACPEERIPDTWITDLTWEMVRDDTDFEAFWISVQRRIPKQLIPPSLRYPGTALRRDRALIAIEAGREIDEVLRALESAYPKAPPDGAQWLMTAYDVISTPSNSGRRSLFLTASRDPDPRVRWTAVALVAGKLNTGKNGDRTDGPVWDRLREMLDDQVSVVREAAGLALAEAAAK